MPVARRVLREEHRITLKMRWNYALALCCDPSATLDDVSEGVSTLEDAGRIARRVLGGAHPTTEGIENALRDAGAALAAVLRHAPRGRPDGRPASGPAPPRSGPRPPLPEGLGPRARAPAPCRALGLFRKCEFRQKLVNGCIRSARDASLATLSPFAIC